MSKTRSNLVRNEARQKAAKFDLAGSRRKDEKEPRFKQGPKSRLPSAGLCYAHGLPDDDGSSAGMAILVIGNHERYAQNKGGNLNSNDAVM